MDTAVAVLYIAELFATQKGLGYYIFINLEVPFFTIPQRMPVLLLRSLWDLAYIFLWTGSKDGFARGSKPNCKLLFLSNKVGYENPS